ncbi:hypothetical protein F511_35086 [Dorcoceras hygrometricum]|uniref:Uncharacterized protein n=1 Tax=Dorcoceras hygrometricum TaxID=472368 RepID=A0A2Z7APA7_9LAMI|nr:hypothetical protein F511_35086 [Dorcoceras hygrometricum]
MLSRNAIPNSCASNSYTVSNSYTISNSCIASDQLCAIPMVAAFRTSRSVLGMSSSTVPEKPVRSGLEDVDRLACQDQLWALDQIAYWNSTQTLPSMQVVTACDGQLSSYWSTQLATLNIACGGQHSVTTT